MPLLIHPVLGTFRMHGQAIQLTGEPHGKIADVDHFLHLSPSFLQALSHFERNQCAEPFFLLAELIPYLPDDFAPLGCREIGRASCRDRAEMRERAGSSKSIAASY